MSARPPRDPLALLVGIEDRYGQAHVIAQPVTITLAGELNSPHRSSFGADRDGDLADLKVGAYIGYTGLGGAVSDRERGLWGCSTVFTPHQVETADQAAGMARVLRRLGKGLRVLNGSDGYLSDDDYAGYLLRVARVLGITHLRVRNTRSDRALTGQHFAEVDVDGLATWLATAVAEVTAGRIAGYTS